MTKLITFAIAADRPARQLVLRWTVCPETGRPVGAWILEPVPAPRVQAATVDRRLAALIDRHRMLRAA
ncbi:hypothetical protein [Rhodoplanes azumiensis]|uniref:Uncharacterized protein n=1 Tax=Rhodoplanes azumiensis TaxID=1897628 RepID=A0ABW5AIR4_9BRAD